MNEEAPGYVLHRNVEDLCVEDIYHMYDREPSVVVKGDPIWKMVAALITRPRGRNVYVTDDTGKLIGIISFRDILRVTNARLGARGPGVVGFAQYLSDLFKEDVKKLMRTPVSVNKGTNLLEALMTMEKFKMNDMPVVDQDEKIIGELSGMEILRFAYEDVRRGDEEAPKIEKEAWEKRQKEG